MSSRRCTESKMDILILNYEYPPIGGGGGRATKELAEGFSEEGHDVDVVTSRATGLPRREEKNGVNIHRVQAFRKDLNSASLASLLTYPASAFPTALRLCREKDYGFINTHFAVPTGPLGVAVSKLFSIPNILSIHGGDIYSPTKALSPHRNAFFSQVVQRVIRSSDRVVAQSTDIRSRAQEHHNVEDQEIDIVPLPYTSFELPDKQENKKKLDEETDYIISVGRLVERKNYSQLIEVISRLEDSIEAIIIGEGPLRGKLERKAKEEGLEKRITLVGEVSEAEKFQYLREADLYALSSLHEGFGICLQEAMDMGLPIVATDNGGHTDFVKDRENGYIVPAGDVEKFAKRVEQVLSQDTTKMERRNKERIKDFTPSKICRRYIEIAQETSQR